MKSAGYTTAASGGRAMRFEAARAQIAYGFEHLNLHKVCAETIDPVEVRPLMKKLGMKEEGVFRQHTRDLQEQLGGSALVCDPPLRLAGMIVTTKRASESTGARLISCFLCSDDLDQHPFVPFAVKLVIENLLPGAKVQPAAGDGLPPSPGP